jgi:glycosyltransferase involved in cell wall biosynthesis
VTFDRALLRVTHLIHDLRPGGAEHLLVDLAGIAGQAGMEISVVSMRPLADFRFAEQLGDAGVRLESLGLAGWWDPRGTARLRGLLPELRPDILHSHLKHSDFVAGRVASAAAIPHVSTLHLIEDGSGWRAARKRDLAIRSRLRTAAKTIAVSDAVRGWYLAVSGASAETVVTIHNGVPDPSTHPIDADGVRAELGIATDALLAVMVAVMRPGKGHDVLLDAIGRLENKEVVFLLAGDGPDSDALRTRAAGIDRVVFAGFRDDVSTLLAAADLVVHPSTTDALPTALVHAIAAGRPIVASAIGGIPEIVPRDGGELVAPGDPVSLAAAIDRLAADAAARFAMGKNARRRYEEEFTAAMWAERLRDLYAGLLQRS